MPQKRSSMRPDTGLPCLSRAHQAIGQSVLNAPSVRKRQPRKHYASAPLCDYEARDISMQSSILYNIAAFHVSRISIEDAFGESTDDESFSRRRRTRGEFTIGNLDAAELDSSRSAQRISAVCCGRSSLPISGKWSQAEAIGRRASHPRPPLTARCAANARYQLNVRDAEPCSIKVTTRLVPSGRSHLGQLTGRVDPDDRAACHARLPCAYPQTSGWILSSELSSRRR
mgnify:CR=1 FL=1